MDSGEQLKTLTSHELIGPNDRFGFKLGLSTDGVEDYDKFEPRKHVKDVHVIFTPETTVDANGTRSKTFLEGVSVTELPKNAVGVDPEPEP